MGEINMLVAKFVDNNYMCGNISYDTFGIPIEQYMLVLPINEDVSIDSIELQKKAILLEVSEENIINCQRNSSFHVNKAIPIRYLNDEELSILKSAYCKNSYYAYNYAIYVDQKPTDETRNAACQKSETAYWYARDVDQKPTDKTRSVACQHPHFAYKYAKYVDRKPTNETRFGACRYPEYAFYYARDVDKKPTNETRNAVSKDPYYKEKYAKWEKTIC
jgi:hypothetical protein